MLNLKTMFTLEKKKHTIISEMSWCNVLQKPGSNYCVNNFPGIFADFRLRNLTKK